MSIIYSLASLVSICGEVIDLLMQKIISYSTDGNQLEVGVKVGQALLLGIKERRIKLISTDSFYLNQATMLIHNLITS